jgi:hypothetical protein
MPSNCLEERSIGEEALFCAQLKHIEFRSPGLGMGNGFRVSAFIEQGYF